MIFSFAAASSAHHSCRHLLASMLLLATLLSAAASAADVPATPAANKELRTVFIATETGFDPAVTRDIYSNAIIEAVFDRLYGYDYLASPAKIVPEAAASLPEVSADGMSYTIRLKQHILFADDPAFHGKARELTVNDFVYSFKRLMDPRIASPHQWLLEGKIVGLDALAEQAKKSGKFDYDAKLPGFEVIDRYTLRLHLTRPDYNLPMILAYTAASAVAREVIEQYQDLQGQVMANPVGTGPYQLAEWVRGAKIVLAASKTYREEYWHFSGNGTAADRKIIAAMENKRIPQINRIVINIIVEAQSRLLAFQQDEIDLFELTSGLSPQVIRNNRLKPELAAKGMQLSHVIQPELVTQYWNMRDPVVGGLTKEKIALRRAIAMAYDVEEEIHVIAHDQAVALQYPIPPGVVGHDPDYVSSIQYDLSAANALLDRFGYRLGADGFRRLPNGAPLTITYTSTPDSSGYVQAEFWKKTYDKLKIRMKSDFRPFAEILKAEKNCQLTQRNAPWLADYPDADNFMQLFYSKNIYMNNNGCVAIPAYDRLYEQSQKLPAGAARDRLYHKMARIMEVYSAQRITAVPYTNYLLQARVIGYKKHPIMHTEWRYLDIDPNQ